MSENGSWVHLFFVYYVVTHDFLHQDDLIIGVVDDELVFVVKKMDVFAEDLNADCVESPDSRHVLIPVCFQKTYDPLFHFVCCFVCKSHG